MELLCFPSRQRNITVMLYIGKQNEFTNKVDTDLHARALIQLSLQCSWLNSQLKFKWWAMGSGEYKTLNTDIAVNYSYNNKQTKYNKC